MAHRRLGWGPTSASSAGVRLWRKRRKMVGASRSCIAGGVSISNSISLSAGEIRCVRDLGGGGCTLPRGRAYHCYTCTATISRHSAARGSLRRPKLRRTHPPARTAQPAHTHSSIEPAPRAYLRDTSVSGERVFLNTGGPRDRGDTGTSEACTASRPELPPAPGGRRPGLNERGPTVLPLCSQSQQHACARRGVAGLG